MYLLAAIPFALAAFWMVVVVYRLHALNARLRANLAGCTGYPISKSSRRPADRSSLGLSGVPLRHKGRAAERSGVRSVREMRRDGSVVLHVCDRGLDYVAIDLRGARL